MRAILLVAGTGRVAVFVLVALVAFFFADYLLRLPLWVRTVTLLLLLAGTAVVTLRRLLAPLARRLDDNVLARRIERAFPDLEDRLLSSLAFARDEKKPQPDSEDSPELMRAVCEEAVRIAEPARFPYLARSSPAARWAGVAAALLAVVVMASVSRADLVRTFARRSLLLRDVAWPRRTTLVIADMEPGRARLITRGRETTVEIRAEGSIPDRVRFSYWESSDRRSSAEIVELTPSSEDAALFAITMPIYESIRFTVAGGDDDREQVYHIDALTPPAVLAIEMECEYPTYLQRADETLAGGDQRVPQGTRITLRIRANMNLRDAFLAKGAAVPAAMKRIDGNQFEATLAPHKDLRYSLRLVGKSGEENDAGSDTYILRVARDQPPTVRVATPGTRPERLPGGVVLVGFNARDDHRIDRTVLRYAVGEDKPREAVFGDAGGDAVSSQRGSERAGGRLVGVFSLDLARFRNLKGEALSKGDQITFRLIVEDSKGQKRETRAEYRVQVVGEGDLDGALVARKGDLRGSLERTLEKALDVERRLDDIDGARGDRAEFRRLCNSSQAAQARVIEDIEAIARRVQSILDTYVFNRLGDRSSADQMLPFYERHLLQREGSGRAFGGELYGDIWAAYNEKAIRVGDAHIKLVEMAGLADRLAAEHGPQGYRGLGEMARAADEATYGNAKRKVATAQRKVADGLKRLRRLTQEWQNYEGVIRFFRDLQRRQQQIVEDLAPDKR